MTEPLPLHTVTKERVERLLARAPHAVLLLGPTGSGKMPLAHAIAEQLLAVPTGKLMDYPYVRFLEADNGTLSVAAVREIEHFLSLTVPSNNPFNRAVLINQAETLTAEAQNALLKTLEEPPKGTILILSSNHAQALLPTVRSRLQTIQLQRPTESQLTDYFSKQGYDKALVKQTYALSGGLPGLMQALLSDSDHPLKAATEQARQLLQLSVFDRLCAVDSLTKKRDLTQDTCTIMQQMAHLSLQKATGSAAKRWQRVLQASYDAQAAMAANVQLKLLLTDFMLQL